MKKVITEGILNNILFILIAWVLIQPTKLSIISFFLFLMSGLIIVTAIAYQETGSFLATVKQLIYGVQSYTDKDERDTEIKYKAAYAAYQTLIVTLVTSLGVVAFVQFLNFLNIFNLSIYTVTIITLVVNCIFIQSTFCFQWCRQYIK